ncbi:myosin-binding protein 1-like [Zingiber officinale]|uniref:myosin-binding protein 1-like n=1 Tax=Zingiber officinale TaxID=94328 RepID=UPI001C4AE737|nr:myosin-binding protein 1-like [Zingiber officinale]
MASKAPVSGVRGFSKALSSAVLEWILMFLLFINALFSYLVTKFSRLCMLQTPCLLCSRLDHIFGNEKPGFYLDLICKDHRTELSPLSFCSVHGNFADICKSCLLSTSTERKSTLDTYKQFTGKLKGDSHDHDDAWGAEEGSFSVFHGDELANIPYLKRDQELHAIGLEEDKPIKACVSKVDIPSSSSPRKGFVKIEDGQRKIKDKILDSPTSFQEKNQGVDYFSHVGYTEVKISSDSDLESLVTHNEGNSLAYGDDNTHDDSVSDIIDLENVCISKKSSSATVLDGINKQKLIHPAAVNISEDRVLEKLIHFAPLPNEPFASTPEKQINVAEFSNEPSSSSNAAGCSSVDNNSSQIEVKLISMQYEMGSHDSPEGLVENSNVRIDIELLDASFIILDDKKDACASHVNLRMINDANEHGQTNMDLNDSNEHTVGNTGSSSSPGSSQVIMRKDSSKVQEDLTSQSSESMNRHMDLNNANDLALVTHGSLPPKLQEDLISGPGQSMSIHMDLDDAYKLAISTSGSMPSRFTEVMMKKDSFTVQEDLVSESGQTMSTNLDMNDAYQLATKRSLLSPRFTEVIMGKDSSRVQEDLKLLISQISAAQGLESPWNEMAPSPRSFTQDDESVLQNITKTLSLERNRSGLESLECGIVGEVEGESAVERLKRQVELDRKSISLLFKELEEERNASAIAANQSMAMITRLQEEKASMQMEAMHYQRMMEEQAEYDHEALQKCNELLAQRDEEIQALQYEVESYRRD